MQETTYQHLGQKTFWFFVSKKATAAFVFLVLALILAIVRVHATLSPQGADMLQLSSRISLAIAIITGVIGFFVARLSYKSFSFTLADNALKIREGILTQEETAIPYRQIQDIKIERTMAHRAMGLSRIIIATAREDNPDSKDENESETVFPAIDMEVALALQNELLQKANIQRVINVGA
jgi:membrane protein YdbS with pleckstrin-like domain